MIRLTKGFLWADTYGVPLSFQMDIARRFGAGISMPHYCADALLAGWTLDRAILRVEEALLDTGETREDVDSYVSQLRYAAAAAARLRG